MPSVDRPASANCVVAISGQSAADDHDYSVLSAFVRS
jgi:hypothetical protein